MDGEIRMDAQMAAAPGQVQAAAHETGVGDQPLDPGHFLQKSQERFAVQLGQQVPGRGEGNFAGRELIFRTCLGAVEEWLASQGGIMPGDAAQQFCIGQIIDNDVREWFGTPIFARQSPSGSSTLVAVEGEVATRAVAKSAGANLRDLRLERGEPVSQVEASGCVWTNRLACSLRSAAFCTLPMALRGKLSTMKTRRGCLKRASSVTMADRMPASVNCPPGSRATTATTASPRSGCGTPITADSATPGSASIASSISLG